MSKPHMCPTCNRRFATETARDQHAHDAHEADPAKPFACKCCKSKFANKADRKKHMRKKHYGMKGDHYQPPGKLPRLSTREALGLMEGFDDMPDGAFFAMANDLGLEPEDFIE